MIQGRFLNTQLIYGNRFQRFIRDLLTNSGIFWLFDLVRKIGLVGVVGYFGSLSHWALLGAGIIQAWVISKDDGRVLWWHHFIAPIIYTAVDIFIEGAEEFISSPYHFLYWGWALCMAGAYLLSGYSKPLSTVLKSLLLVLLLPASYALSEWNLLATSFIDYWLEPSHFFILSGALVLGLVLGITNIMRDRLATLLYALAGHFEQIASWSFDKDLIEKSYGDDKVLALHRTERTVLFMDIRGFTPWSELHTPQEVVEMVNLFYRISEPIIKANNGFKIQMTGDEVMTRFYSAQEAFNAAYALQTAMQTALAPFQLNIGIGIHTGDVIEGLVGGEQTMQYGIFGDVVNTSARLQSQAKAGEIIISQTALEKIIAMP
ncbi:MAG TPA: adenylate/guanylate cyclase domain-containing protein, partial [Aggregatilineales bacterium]|nr:adenylate/guanylate cyclase domain-containing protein [Aggregatilineales bacterium]